MPVDQLMSVVAEPKEARAVVTLSVVGMTCQSCVKSVQNALLTIQGVESADVSLDNGGRATVVGSALDGDLVGAVKSTGKTATILSIQPEHPSSPAKNGHFKNSSHDAQPRNVVHLSVSGMACSSCVKSVQNALLAVQGVDRAEVSLGNGGSATVLGSALDGDLVHAVRSAGKEATILSIQPEYPSLPVMNGHAINSSRDAKPRTVVQLGISGMTCSSCVKSVQNALLAVQGVDRAEVSLDNGGTATVIGIAFDSDLARAVNSTGKVATILSVQSEPEREFVMNSHDDDIGFVNTASTIVLSIRGMTCGSCVKRVQDALRAVPGVSSVDVTLERDGEAVVKGDASANALIDAVSAVGKSATISSTSKIADTVLAQPSIGAVPEVKNDQLTDVALSQGSTPDKQEQSTVLDVSGMTCESCVKTVSDALHSVSGVLSADVTLDNGGRAFVIGNAPVQSLIDAVSAVGKTATAASAESRPGRDREGVEKESAGIQLVEVQLSTSGDMRKVEPRTVKTVKVISAPPAQFSESDSNALGSRISNEDGRVMALRVSGMTCSSCVAVVEKILTDVPGVISARVSLLSERATVVHTNVKFNPVDVVAAVENGGYRCDIIDNHDGYSGARRSFLLICLDEHKTQAALHVLRACDEVLVAVERQDIVGVGVELVENADIATVLRELEHDGHAGNVRLAMPEEVEARKQNVSDLFPQVSFWRRSGSHDGEAAIWRSRFALACFFTIPLMIVGFIAHHTGLIPEIVVLWVGLALASPVQFVCGRPFYRASYYAIRKRRATMDVLISLSTSVAYFTSLAVVAFSLVPDAESTQTGSTASLRGIGHTPMFNVSAMIITIVTFGKWLEATAKRRAAAGVASLAALVPKDAILYDIKEQVARRTRVPVSLLRVGDHVRVGPGERIPVDALVVEGHSAVDESMLTGESNPVPKTKSDCVYGGTTNGNGSMLLRTSAVEEDAVLAQIVKLVDEAQTCRAPIEAYADRISAYFVPSVVALSVCVFIVWYFLAASHRIPQSWYAEEGMFTFALLFGLETMVIACPCALGLATPTAVMVASEVGARLGVLVRGGGAALEAAQHVQTILFDKTGTLTMGKPEVAAVVVGTQAVGTATVRDVTELVCSLVQVAEVESRHPHAAAVLDYIEARVNYSHARAAFHVLSVEELGGRGVQALVKVADGPRPVACPAADNFRVLVGSLSWALSGLESKVLTDAEIELVRRLECDDGLSIVAAVVNETFVVVFGLSDVVRQEAASVISYLQNQLGISCGIVTGDSEATAHSVARQVGVDPANVTARAMPWMKMDAIRKLPKGTSCFVGDGINDAPALAAADVSIALGAGAPIAAQNSSIVLVRSDLNGVVHTFDLARKSFRRVRFNLVLALGYNMLCIPLAAGAFFPTMHLRVPPVLASASMAVSSTCVILSSLALRWYKPPAVDAHRSSFPEDSSTVHGLRARQTRRRGMGPTYVLVDEENEV